MKKDIPKHVNWGIRNAWLAIPPCWPTDKEPYCHIDCPYFNECYITEEEESNKWDEY